MVRGARIHALSCTARDARNSWVHAIKLCRLWNDEHNGRSDLVQFADDESAS
jgi:hypothetical protein